MFSIIKDENGSENESSRKLFTNLDRTASWRRECSNVTKFIKREKLYLGALVLKGDGSPGFRSLGIITCGVSSLDCRRAWAVGFSERLRKSWLALFPACSSNLNGAMLGGLFSCFARHFSMACLNALAFSSFGSNARPALTCSRASSK